MAQHTCAQQTSALPYSCSHIMPKAHLQVVPRPGAHITAQLSCLQSNNCPACRLSCQALIGSSSTRALQHIRLPALPTRTQCFTRPGCQ